MNALKQSRYVYLLPCIAVVIWSVNLIVTKLAVDVIPAFSISFYRWVLAFTILTPFTALKVWRDRHIVIPYLPKLAVLGLFGMVMYQGLAYEAAHTTSATNLGVLNAMIPIFTVVIAIILLRERVSRWAIVGCVLSFVGILILIGKGNPLNVMTGNFHLGDVLMLVAVVCYAAYGVLTRLWQIKLDLWTNLYLQIGFGVIFHLPLMMYQGFTPITTDNLWMILYAGTLASLVAPLVWIKAIQLIGPNRTSIFLNLMPILTAIIAVGFLHEEWHFYHTVGAVLTLLGVALAQIKPKLISPSPQTLEE